MVRFHYQYSDPDFGKNMADKLAALHDPAGEVVSEDELHSITPHLVVGVWTRREA